jgi:hypothetical protein
MHTPLGLIGKNRPMMANSPTASQAMLITTTAEVVCVSKFQSYHLTRRKGDQGLIIGGPASR